jgi:regulator of nucleoside diphosphate kinase
MKTNELNPVVITREDYELLKPLIERRADKQDEMSLGHELSRAIIVKKDALPPFTVRLNSKVTVVNQETQRVMEFMIVMPEQADIGQQKVSILSPMGTALIGFRKGEEVLWQVPAGLKRFRILDVVNNPQVEA